MLSRPAVWACVWGALMLGYCAASVLVWVTFIVLPYAQTIRRTERVRHRQLTTAVLRDAQHSETLAKLGPLLPAWLNLEDTEPSEFVNTALVQMWPYVKSAVELALRKELGLLLASISAPVVGELCIDTLDLGNQPPAVLGIRTRVCPKHTVSIDLRVQSAGEKNVILRAGKFPVHLRNLEVHGTLRLSFGILAPGLPGFRAVAVSFIRKPVIKCALAAVHVPLPTGLTQALAPLIADNLARVVVWPRKIIVPLLPITPAQLATLSHRGGEGAVCVKITGVHLSDACLVDLAARGFNVTGLAVRSAGTSTRFFGTVRLNDNAAQRTSAKIRPTTARGGVLGWAEQPIFAVVFDYATTHIVVSLMVQNSMHREGVDTSARADDGGLHGGDARYEHPAQMVGCVDLELGRFSEGINTVTLPISGCNDATLTLAVEYRVFQTPEAPAVAPSPSSSADSGPTSVDGEWPALLVYAHILHATGLPALDGTFVRVTSSPNVAGPPCLARTFETSASFAENPVYDADAHFFQRELPRLDFSLLPVNPRPGWGSPAAPLLASLDLANPRQRPVNGQLLHLTMGFGVTLEVELSIYALPPAQPTGVAAAGSAAGAVKSPALAARQESPMFTQLPFATHVLHVTWFFVAFLVGHVCSLWHFLPTVGAWLAVFYGVYRVLLVEGPSPTPATGVPLPQQPQSQPQPQPSGHVSALADQQRAQSSVPVPPVNFDLQTHGPAERALLLAALQQRTLYTYGERVFWLNQALVGLWPTLAPSLEKIILEQLQPILARAKPQFLSHLELACLQVGNEPPVVTGVRHFKQNVRGEPLVLDFDLSWATDTSLTLVAGRAPCLFATTVSDICIDVRLRLEFDPLVPVLPCFAGISVSFADFPPIDANIVVHPYRTTQRNFRRGTAQQSRGLYLNCIPGVMSFTRSILQRVLTPVLVAPMKVHLPLFQIPRPRDPCASAAGILRVRVLCAKQLPGSELLLGAFDSSCVVKVQQLGLADNISSTTVAPADSAPEWNSTFEFVVHHTTSCRVRFTVRGHKRMGAQPVLGVAEVRLAQLLADVETECSLPLRRRQGAQGTLHAELTWKPFVAGVTPAGGAQADAGLAGLVVANFAGGAGTETPPDSPVAQRRAGPVSTPTPTFWAGGVLTVHIISIAHLSRSHPDYDRVAVQLKLGGQQHTTPEKLGRNPVFDSTCAFFVHSTTLESVSLTVMDAADGVLGRLTFHVQDVIRSNALGGSWRLLDAPSGVVQARLAYAAVAPYNVGHRRVAIPNSLTFIFGADGPGLAPDAEWESSTVANLAGGPPLVRDDESPPRSRAASMLSTTSGAMVGAVDEVGGASGVGGGLPPAPSSAMALFQQAATQSNDIVVDGLALGLTALYFRFFGAARGHMEDRAPASAATRTEVVALAPTPVTAGDATL